MRQTQEFLNKQLTDATRDMPLALDDEPVFFIQMRRIDGLETYQVFEVSNDNSVNPTDWVTPAMTFEQMVKFVEGIEFIMEYV